MTLARNEHVEAGGGQPRNKRAVATYTRLAFYSALLVVLLGYTGMAFQLDWFTQAGRVGPGFFPRVIGVIGTIICTGALLKSARNKQSSESEDLLTGSLDDGEDLGKYPIAAAVAIFASFIFVLTLSDLGAILASALFLIIMLSYLNRNRWPQNLALAISVPVVMYLLFSTALDAELPSGLLPW